MRRAEGFGCFWKNSKGAVGCLRERVGWTSKGEVMGLGCGEIRSGRREGGKELGVVRGMRPRWGIGTRSSAKERLGPMFTVWTGSAQTEEDGPEDVGFSRARVFGDTGLSNGRAFTASSTGEVGNSVVVGGDGGSSTEEAV